MIEFAVAIAIILVAVAYFKFFIYFLDIVKDRMECPNCAGTTSSDMPFNVKDLRKSE